MQPTKKPTALPGRTVPAHIAWVSSDNTMPSDGVAYPEDPFALTALLAEADSAAPATCPAGLAAADCYTAVVVTGHGRDPLGDYLAWAQHRSGRPFQTLDVGLDSQGRPAFVRLRIDVRILGTSSQTLAGTTRFTAYGPTPPPVVTRPDPAAVVHDADVDA